MNTFCFPRQTRAYVNEILCLKASCPSFCVYSFKEFSFTSNLMCRLKLNLLLKFSARAYKFSRFFL